MADRDPKRKIAAAALQALKEALTYAYWYKSDLRSFLNHAITDPSILTRLSWDGYKRNIVGSLVDFLARNEDVYQRQLLRLLTETAKTLAIWPVSTMGNPKFSRRELQSTLCENRSRDISI